jgi:predicted transcriptional regulator
MYVLLEQVEKGIGRFGQAKSILSIGLGCEAKYAKDFVYTENVNINDKVNRNSNWSFMSNL